MDPEISDVLEKALFKVLCAFIFKTIVLLYGIQAFLNILYRKSRNKTTLIYKGMKIFIIFILGFETIFINLPLKTFLEMKEAAKNRDFEHNIHRLKDVQLKVREDRFDVQSKPQPLKLFWTKRKNIL